MTGGGSWCIYLGLDFTQEEEEEEDDEEEEEDEDEEEDEEEEQEEEGTLFWGRSFSEPQTHLSLSAQRSAGLETAEVNPDLVPIQRADT